MGKKKDRLLQEFELILGSQPWPEVTREYRFHPTRKFRFDYAFVQQRIAVELEGGIWTGGAHTRGKHFLSDCEKYNEAAILGWTVLRFATESGHIAGDPIDTITRALKPYFDVQRKVREFIIKQEVLTLNRNRKQSSK